MRKHLPALAVCLWLTVLALSGFLVVLNIFREQVQENFNRSAAARVLAIRSVLEEKLLILESIQSLYAIFDGKPQPEFGAFVQPFEAELEGVQALLWVVPVTAEARADFESARQAEGITDFQITERNANGDMVRARERAVYYPVYPLLPLDIGEATIGYDMGSSAERMEAIQRAITTTTAAATTRVSLIQERTGGQYGFLLFLPLFNNNSQEISQEDVQVTAAPAGLLGFTTGVFRISDIVEAVNAGLNYEHIRLTLRDATAPVAEQLLYTLTPTPPEGSPRAGFFTRQFQPADYMNGFAIGGRDWEITATPMPDYMADKPPLAALLVLATGLFIAWGTAVFLALNQQHTDRMRAEREKGESLENHLIRAQKLEAIGQFVGGIAHDFNNVLTSIIGYGELAKESVRDPQLEQYIGIILQSSEKGKGLIHKLLSFSRNQPTHAQPHALQPLAENIISMLQPVMTARVSMHFTVDPDLPLVSVDSTSFDQLLVNLCVNARDAISGTGRIDIGLHHTIGVNARCLSCGEVVTGNWVMLSVRDSGSGMTPEVLVQIFKPFFTTKEDGKGTGLGLLIINNLTHGCGGHLLVESAPGKGTTFKLFFPAVSPHY